MKKVITLNNGSLEVIELWDKKLLLGEILDGYTTRDELKAVLAGEGYSYGLLEKCIELLEKGYVGQIPVALAYLEDEAGKLWYHFEKAVNNDIFLKWLKAGKVDELNLLYPVKKDDRLVSLSQPPINLLRYPNGGKEILKELSERSISLYIGENTALDSTSNSLIAKIAGSAHRNIYGVVSAYPIKSFKSIGKIHGKIRYENALEIEDDIKRESNVVLPSNLLVRGMIRSAFVKVEGNIQSGIGFDNSNKTKNASISAGQSIFTTMIRSYDVWAGMYIIVRNTIENSNVQCMDTIFAPCISKSEIRVANKLYVRDITYSSQIYLGPYYVKDPELKSFKNYHLQHEKRLEDLGRQIEEQIRILEGERLKVNSRINRLNSVSKDSISSDLPLKRFYHNLKHKLDQVISQIDDYKKTMYIYEEEKLQLSFYDSHLHNENNPEIIVFGKLSSGTVIIAPNQKLKIGNQLSQVSIKLDKKSGALKIEKL